MKKVVNGYARGKVEASDKGKGLHNQQKMDLSEKKVKASHDERDDSPKYKPTPDQDHKGFQLGGNPMYQDSFEKRLIEREKRERELARERFVEGIQGRDGGKKPYECYNVNN